MDAQSLHLPRLEASDFASLIGAEPASRLQGQFDPVQSRKILLSHGVRLPSSRVVSIQMLKGGVAKTTTVLNLALRASQFGLKVLIVDLDQQANLSYGVLGSEFGRRPVWIDSIEGGKSMDDLIVPITNHLHLIPSDLNNSMLERTLLLKRSNLATAILKPLSQIQPRYDLILMDTAPQLSAVNTAVACASDLVILPVNPDRFSIMGAQMTLKELKMISEEFMRGFECRVLFTKFDARERLSRELLAECTELFGSRMLDTYLRLSIDYRNTLESPKTIFDSKRSSAREDYSLLFEEILNLITLVPSQRPLPEESANA